MDHLIKIKRNIIIIIISILLIGLIIYGIKYYKKISKESNKINNEIALDEVVTEKKSPVANNNIDNNLMVEIKGQVKNPNTYKVSKTTRVIDVGQGDCILLHFQNKNILIDTGGSLLNPQNHLQTDNVINSLKSLGITKLNYLILTHGDYDHMGESIHLINKFKIETVIFNNDKYNDLEKQLIKTLNNKKIKYYKGLKLLNINNNLRLYFLNIKIYDNENNNSNVIYFKYNKYKFLLMGDAGIERERDIINKYNLHDIDFLKIGHHGSNTSSGKYFINSIKPKNCLISVGKNNKFGHPKKSVLNTLKTCNIYRTDLNGSIEIKLNKHDYEVKTFSP